MSNFYGAIGLIGGASGALDAIDGAGLADGDGAVVIVDGISYAYHLDASLGGSESSPNIITPDANPGTKRWTLCTPYAIETTRTINFTSGMSSATIQALIDAVGRNIPNGVTLTFQFGDGTYTLDTELDFEGFYGGGIVNIQGNDAESKVLHTNQAAILDFNNDTHGIVGANNTATVNVYNLRVDFDSVTDVRAFFFTNCFRATFLGNYALGDGASNGAGWQCQAGFFYLNANYVSNMKYGIRGIQSRLYSDGNDDTGTQPAYGLYCQTAGTIGKNGTQPAGSTANEGTAGGGVIR